MTRPRVDPIAVAAAVLALGTAVAYVGVMREQSDQPVVWFLGALILGATAAGYGSREGAHHRRAVLLLAGVVLVAVGALAILSVGFPVLVAGALCLGSALRTKKDVGVA